MCDNLGIADEKKRVFLFSDGNYSNVVFESVDAILEWIKADSDGALVGDEFEYTIRISEMTQQQIDNLPEAD
jgi:hypothetical protein